MGYYLLTHGSNGRDAFPDGVLQGWPSLPEDIRRKKIDFIAYYLSCFSGSKLTFYLAIENMNKSKYALELNY